MNRLCRFKMSLTFRSTARHRFLYVASIGAGASLLQCGGSSTGIAPSGGAGSSVGGTQSSAGAGGGAGRPEESGAGGEGDGASPGSALGDACDSPGELACAGHHQKLKLVCGKERTWESNGTCGGGEFCQTAATVDLGVCLPEAEECQGLHPGTEACKGGELRECGPDALDSLLVEACKYGCEDGRCRDAALCEEGTADCDEAPDCETDTTSSAKDCGECGKACDGQPHTTGECTDGGCACDESYGDCTDAAGCETPTLDDVDNCGACGNVCLSGRVREGALHDARLRQ